MALMATSPPAYLDADKHARILSDPDVAANLDRRYNGMVAWRDWRIAQLITVETVIVIRDEHL